MSAQEWGGREGGAKGFCAQARPVALACAEERDFDAGKVMQALRSWIVAVWWVILPILAVRAGEAPAGVPTAPASAQTTPAVQPARPDAIAGPVAAPGVLSAHTAPGEITRVKIIPVREPIAKPALYVIRRGLKEAQAAGIRTVVLDMQTPGGELGVTLEIMEALDKFDGDTLVYVNKEAISAGAIISSVADEIYFAPGGVIGAAAAVSGGGEDIAATMKQKINSYMNAKVRSFNAGKAHRAEVIRAMMDADYEFKIGETVIKPKGELLSLTAEEAARTYGEPALALLSAGTHASVEELLAAKYGKGGYALERVNTTWSEKLASWLNAISPVLMGLGLLCVFIEFKTPGFGVFGITGGALLALVFFGHYAAGLSGHEPALVFALGLALVAVEIFLLPGTIAAGLLGVLLMFGALVWSMLDVWPGKMPALGGDVLLRPLLNLLAALGVAALGALALAKVLPRGWFWDKMILQAAVAGDAGAPAEGMGGSGGGGAPTETAGVAGDALIGARGRTVSAMRPMGEVEIAGRRHEARTATGALERDEFVRVTGRSGRVLIVEHETA